MRNDLVPVFFLSVSAMVKLQEASDDESYGKKE
jgi:hypothetical protein